jgi:GTPase involved in cell partitioning and DNA repair
MTHPSTMREALIIEALAEAASLIREVEALQPAMVESGQVIVAAHAQLAEQLAAFEAQIIALTEKAKVQLVKHVLTRTEAAARQAVEEQMRAMTKTGMQLFDSRVDPRIQQLARVITHQIDRLGNARECWWTHAATALAASVASSATTLAIVTHFWNC